MAALMSLPVGTPRALLSDVVRLGRLLWKRAAATGDVDIVEDTSELLSLSLQTKCVSLSRLGTRRGRRRKGHMARGRANREIG